MVSEGFVFQCVVESARQPEDQEAAQDKKCDEKQQKLQPCAKPISLTLKVRDRTTGGAMGHIVRYPLAAVQAIHLINNILL